MTATKDYFTQQIAESVSKALGLPVSDVQLVNKNGVRLTVDIEGPGAESPFWKAVLEQYE
jgi:hypothetical protein